MAQNQAEEVPMAGPEHDLGSTRSIQAEAIGRPGQRRFRIVIEAEGGHATVWLEKQELMQLALTIQEVASAEAKPERPTPRRSAPNQPVRMEFQAGRLAMGYERRSDSFILDLSDQESPDVRTPTIRVAVSREQVSAFAEQALAVCAAGRQPCPLCGAPLDPAIPHICPRSNGHVKT
jgi:uncharacterized repeat protein (TIGR03847 family)